MIQLTLFQTMAKFLEPLLGQLGEKLPSAACCSSCVHNKRTLTFIAKLSYRYSDTVLRAQTLASRSNTSAVMGVSQYDHNSLSLDFTGHIYQAQHLNDLEFNWGTNLYELSANQSANPAVTLYHYSESGAQEYMQHPPSAQNQDAEISCVPVSPKKSIVETSITEVFSKEWTCMENQVHPLSSESPTNTEIESVHHSPTTSEFSNTALGSSNLGEPSGLCGGSTPSSTCLTDLNACDEVHKLEPITESPQFSQYDACFGVVSH